MRSSLWDCSDAYILVSRTITAAEIVAGGENNNAGYDKKNFPFFFPYSVQVSGLHSAYKRS